MSRINLVLGTMTMNMSNVEDSRDQLNHFLTAYTSRGTHELDTARMYNHGATETLLGSLLSEDALSGRYVIATKANPFKDYNKSLGNEGVRNQCRDSLAALRIAKADIFYLHAPDQNTTIEETLITVHELYTAGHFKELGLSNYAAWEVAYIHHYCEKMGFVKPTVYQGMYNAVTRQVSLELVPCLRKLGIRFYIYNPLCGGLLSGKYSFKEETKGGRFFNNQQYKDRYWNASYFQACDIIRDACGDAVSMPEAAFRWLNHHSDLKPECGDGIILGASSLKYLKENIQSCLAGPLPENIVRAFDEAFRVVNTDNTPCYFRGVSKLE